MNRGLPLSGGAVALFAQPINASAHESAGRVVVQFDDLPVQLEIIDLKQTDDNATLTLRGAVKNPSGQEYNLGNTYDMTLISFKNRRKYNVLQDDSSYCVCSTSGLEAPPGGSIHLWAKFPAPPDPVTKIPTGWGRAQPIDVQITE